MQADLGGDLAQRQRPQGAVAELQERRLLLQQAAGDLQQGVAARLQTLQQPAGFLKMAAQVTRIGAAGVADHAFVAAVDADARARAIGQRHPPQAVLAPDHHVRGDIDVGGDRTDLSPGTRIQRAQQLHGGVDLDRVQFQFGGQAGDADPGQSLQRAVGQRIGQLLARRLVGQGLQLQPQTLAQRARADPDRIESLHLVQHGQDLVFAGFDLRRQRGGNGIQRLAQVAVVVDRLDQGHADRTVARRQVAQVQLPQQVVVQGLVFGHLFSRLAVIVAVAGADALVPRLAVGTAPELLVGGRQNQLVAASKGRVVRRRDLSRVGPVEQRIALDRGHQFGIQFDRRQLQQAYRLPQLRGHDQMLSQRGL